MRKPATIFLEEDVLEELRNHKRETGIPISRALENAWKKEQESAATTGGV